MTPNIEVVVVKDGSGFYPFINPGSFSPYVPPDQYFATGGKIVTVNVGDIVDMREEEIASSLTGPSNPPRFPTTIVSTRIKTLNGEYKWLNCTQAQLANIIKAAS